MTAVVTPVEEVTRSDDASGAHGRSDSGRRIRARLAAAPLWQHVLGLLLLLCALVPFTRAGTAFTTDEGAYGLAQRSLAFHWPGASVDPHLRWYPIVNGTVTSRGTFPYITHPAYPIAQRLFAGLLGETAGLLVLPLAGLIGTAVAAWVLAALVDRRTRPVAFWVAAVSPVLFNGWVIWAHAPSAALGGLALAAAVAAGRAEQRQRRLLLLAAAAGATVAGSLLRSENVIGGAAAAVAFAVVAWPRGGLRGRGMTVRIAGVLTGGAVIAAAGLITAKAEAMWRLALTGGGGSVVGVRQNSGSLLAGRLAAAYHSFLSPAMGSRALDGLWLAVLGVVAISGAVAAFGKRAGFALPAAAVMLAMLIAVHVLAVPMNPLVGLLAAWPVLVLAVPPALVGAARRREIVGLVGAISLVAIGVAVSQYPEGGGYEWGGRFLSVATVPLAVVASVGIRRLLAGHSPERMQKLAALTILTIAPAVAGIAVMGHVRGAVDRIDAEVLAGRPAVVVTSGESLPRNAWRSHRATVWYRVPPAEVDDALAALRNAGSMRVRVVEPAIVLSDAGQWNATVARRSAPALEGAGWVVLDLDLKSR